MNLSRKLLFGIASIILLGAVSLVIDGNSVAQNNKEDITAQLYGLSSMPETVKDVTPPEINTPLWLQRQNASTNSPEAPPSPTGEVATYSVQTKGVTSTSIAEFKAQAHATLNDPRGWGLNFQEVESGGGFVLVMSEASQVPSFSPACSAFYSCRVGQYVIINEDRWLGATPSWNNAGGSLRDYQHMVINHEVGHWLGHGHANCPSPGSPAPVMLQQSIDLQGCKFNPWPLESER